jgi:lactoylglutathione lyase
MENSTICGLSHIAVMTDNMDKSIEFYTSLLNFTCTHRQFLQTTELAFLQVGDCVVELVAPAENGHFNNLKAGQINHLALKATDLELEITRLERAGIQFEEPAKTVAIFENGVRNIFLAGPSGERIEIFQNL